MTTTAELRTLSNELAQRLAETPHAGLAQRLETAASELAEVIETVDLFMSGLLRVVGRVSPPPAPMPSPQQTAEAHARS